MREGGGMHRMVTLGYLLSPSRSFAGFVFFCSKNRLLTSEYFEPLNEYEIHNFL